MRKVLSVYGALSVGVFWAGAVLWGQTVDPTGPRGGSKRAGGSAGDVGVLVVPEEPEASLKPEGETLADLIRKYQAAKEEARTKSGRDAVAAAQAAREFAGKAAAKCDEYAADQKDAATQFGKARDAVKQLSAPANENRKAVEGAVGKVGRVVSGMGQDAEAARQALQTNPSPVNEYRSAVLFSLWQDSEERLAELRGFVDVTMAGVDASLIEQQIYEVAASVCAANADLFTVLGLSFRAEQQLMVPREALLDQGLSPGVALGSMPAVAVGPVRMTEDRKRRYEQ